MQGKISIAMLLLSAVAGFLFLVFIYILVLSFLFTPGRGIHAKDAINIPTPPPTNTSFAPTPTVDLEALHAKYLVYAQKNLQGPQQNTTTKTYSITGIYFLPLENDVIQVVTSIGALSFDTDNLTTFQLASSNPSSTQGEFISHGVFIGSLKKGTLIQINYTQNTTNPRALKMVATNNFVQ